ncbi:hypothetical protein AFK24_26085 [Pseudomonas syringae]|uniref:DUF3077 domain-containing protein n=1 Tax=Pseudomonas syringae TaxID=317 RepID=A0A1C7Z0M1_PSESX|nr:hypothetical protein [Pseudomonas syringae]OCR22557.1 hypothetical protein AFK24_26085 [Pseudomonas syringae]
MTHHEQTHTIEQLINDTDELLRCAKATAYESADALRGNQRDHAFSVVYLIEMARGKLDQLIHAQAECGSW